MYITNVQAVADALAEAGGLATLVDHPCDVTHALDGKARAPPPALQRWITGSAPCTRTPACAGGVALPPCHPQSLAGPLVPGRPPGPRQAPWSSFLFMECELPPLPASPTDTPPPLQVCLPLNFKHTSSHEASSIKSYLEQEGELWSASSPSPDPGASSAASPGPAAGPGAAARLPPCSVLRQPMLRMHWWRSFARAERVPWRTFWKSVAASNAMTWGLDGRLDKFTQVGGGGGMGAGVCVCVWGGGGMGSC